MEQFIGKEVQFTQIEEGYFFEDSYGGQWEKIEETNHESNKVNARNIKSGKFAFFHSFEFVKKLPQPAKKK